MTTRAPSPPDSDERSILLGWLAFHRDALAAKCDGLTDAQLVERSAPPSTMTLLGLVRHLTEMEHVYGSWAIGPDAPFSYVYGEYQDGGPEWDFDVDASMAASSFDDWRRERSLTDERVAERTSLDDVGANGRTMRWNLHKLVGEYARHNGHADLLRERIDGATGE